jgi:hypothetical protein
MEDKELKEPTESGVSSVFENKAEVTIGDNKYTIYRLRAGKFYEALKIYMDTIRSMAPKTSENREGEAQVDLDKLIVSMFESWPENMTKFIAVCCYKATTGDNQDQTVEITQEKIREESYPEQITEAFKICFNLNRVSENLKNFVAPMKELGAQFPQVNQG